MHITVSKPALERAIFRADKVTGKNLSLAVLRAVLIVGQGKTLSVRATNLDLGIEISLPANVRAAGTVAVPGDVLSSFLANTPETKDVSLKTAGGALEVATGRGVVSIKTYPHDDFPTLPNLANAQTITLPPKDLVAGLKSVWYSASPSSMKPELSSISVAEEQGDLVFAATDSFRLAEKRLRVPDLEGTPALLIPLKNISEIIRTLEHEDEPVQMRLGENQATFVTQDTNLTTRIVDGTFPDYKQIIPKEFVTEATVLKDDLMNTLKISTIFSNKFNQVLFNLSPKKKQFTIETNNPEVGESTITLDAALSGDDLSIGFNHKYLVDCFQALASDSVVLNLSGPGKPLVIRGVGDASFTYLVMPMNR